MPPSQYEREVLRQPPRSTTARPRPRGGSLIGFGAYCAVGIVPIVVCSQAEYFTVEMLQGLLAVFGLFLTGVEASQSGRWLFPLIALFLVFAVLLQPEMAIALILISAWEFTSNRPTVGSVVLPWFCLTTIGANLL